MKQTTTTTRLPVARNPTALGKMTEAESVTMDEKTNKTQYDIGIRNRWKMRLNVAKPYKAGGGWLGFESHHAMSLSDRS